MSNIKRKSKLHKTAKACRICLAMDRKLYNMKKNNLNVYYENLTGLNVNEEDRLPQKLCWECSYRLISFKRLKYKAVQSYNLMLELLHASRYITYNNLNSIDRLKYNLQSNLGTIIKEPDHADYHLGHDEEENVCKIELVQIDVGDIKEDISDVELIQENDNLSISSNEDVKVKRTDEIFKVDKRKRSAKDVLNDTLFIVTDLSYKEQVAQIEKRRESANFINSSYKCMCCFKGFLDKDAYQGHMTRHTDQSGPYECDICKIRFKKQNALRNHMTSHMQKFSCRQCPYVTTRRHAAKLHERYHSGTRYQCPHCVENFVKFSTYMSHIRIKHPSDFVCELCGYSFISTKGLCLHKKLKHRFDERPVPENGPVCAQCDVKFITSEALDQHMKLSPRHNRDSEKSRKRKRIQRDIPGRSKEKTELMKKKTRDHCKPDTPISCEQCEMQLPDSISYYRHFRRQHPDKNRTNYPSMKSKSMCEVCGKMFQSLALLQDHSFTHDEGKQFRCSVCGKRFQRRYRLIAHRHVHSGRRAEHACRLCDKRFSTASNMHRHMFSHTGLKPFKCEMCGKCFKHASEKRVHINYVHLKKPWPKRSRGKRRTDSGLEQVAPSLTPVTVRPNDTTQPLWPAINDPKNTDTVADQKNVYYNLKM